MAEVEFVQVTWMRAFKVWWSLVWRGALFGSLITAAVGFFLGFFMGLVKTGPETFRSVCTIAGYIIAIPVGIAVIKLVLKNHYSDFRIVLIAERNS